MRIELTRVVADWLLHPDYGVNAYIATIPRDAADPAPPFIAGWADTSGQAQVQELAVFDDTRHEWVARRGDPPALPCLVVGIPDVIDMTGEPWPDGQYRTSDIDIELAVAYISASEDEFRSIRDGEYTLRAVARSVRELTRNVNEASCLRNGVRLCTVTRMRYTPLREAVGAGRMAGGLTLSIHAEDGDPSWAA